MRPHRVSPMLEVPQHIKRPDYSEDGFPESEVELDKEIAVLGWEIEDWHALAPDAFRLAGFGDFGRRNDDSVTVKVV